MYMGCMYKLFEMISQQTTIWISFDERLYTTKEVGHDQEYSSSQIKVYIA